MVSKRHLNQTKSRLTDEVNNTPVDVEPMEKFFNTFDVPIPQKAEAKIQKRQRGKEGILRESTLTQKGKDIDSVQSKSKKGVVIYPTGEQIRVSTIPHEYLNTIMRGVIYAEPPITKTIQVRRTRHAGHCWRSRDELIRDVLLWTPTHGRAKAGRPARTYIQLLCEDTGCCPEDLPRAMNDREEWRERVRDIRATSAIWWWWSSTPLAVVYLLNAVGEYCILLML